MKTLLFLLCLATSLIPIKADIQLRGVVGGEKPVFGLRDSSSGQSAWVIVGGSFSGYVLTSYELSPCTVILKRADETQRITLNEARVDRLDDAAADKELLGRAYRAAANGDAELEILLTRYEVALAERQRQNRKVPAEVIDFLRRELAKKVGR
jgi:hypothetical protein